jgi:CRP-like cAMP-binding protein
VHTGRIKLTKLGENGRAQMIRLLGPGDIMGYRAVVANEPYAASAVTVEDATVCTIPRATIEHLLESSPIFAIELLAKMAHELRLSEEQMMSLTQKSVKERIAQLLLFFHDSLASGGKKPRMLEVPLMRIDMAQMVGVSPETFSRALRRLAHLGIIDVSRTSISIKNLPGLRRAAGVSQT